jgi:hypothetical protein
MGCRVRLSLLAVIGAFVMVGCAETGTPEPRSFAPVDPASEAAVAASVGDPRVMTTARWPFAPERVRIHPLTRFQPADRANDRGPYVELWMEFLDAYGHSTKGLGEIRAELSEIRDPTDMVRGPRIQMWSLSLNDLTTNYAHYDWTTRMYQFRLELPSGLRLDRNALLEVRVRTPGDQRLRTQYVLVP